MSLSNTHTILAAKNPYWSNIDQTSIDCEIEHSVYGWIPFTASKDDSEQHGRELFERLVKDEFGPVAPYVPPEMPDPALVIREQRGQLLLASDWTQLPDVPQTTKDLWSTYRQQLRDITEQTGFPQNVTWPTAPQ